MRFFKISSDFELEYTDQKKNRDQICTFLLPMKVPNLGSSVVSSFVGFMVSSTFDSVGATLKVRYEWIPVKSEFSNKSTIRIFIFLFLKKVHIV